MLMETSGLFTKKKRVEGMEEDRKGREREREMLQDFDTEIPLSMDLLDIYLYFDTKKYGTLWL